MRLCLGISRISFHPPDCNPGNLLVQAEHCVSLQKIEQALELFYQAEQHGADADRCAGGRWYCWMLKGDFAQAWQESDAIRRRDAPDPHRFWNGEDLQDRRVILRSLHGYGDAIQMLRYLPMLRQRAKHVVLEVPPQMYDLARCFSGVDTVIVWGEPSSWDLQIEVMELPYIFRSELHTIPRQIPYLTLPPGAQIQNNADHGLNAGILWIGGEWEPSRSIPFALLHPLLNRKEIRFWSLQRPEDNLEWNDFWLSRNALPLACGNGLLSLAAAIQQMDLVISIDSMAAHLAGALGKPVWTFLPRYADWRWMMHRSDSPWYPTMRLFRQTQQGKWDDVVTAVSAQLSASAARSAC